MSTVIPNSASTASPRSSGIGSLTMLDAKQLWRSDAPQSVRSAWRQDDHVGAWKALTEAFGKRKERAAKGSASKKKKPSPFAWGVSSTVGGEFAAWLADAPHAKRPTPAAQRWCAEAGDRAPDVRFALECVAWASRLPEIASDLGADAWWTLVETLYGIAEEAVAAPTPDLEDQGPEAVDGVVVAQVLAGELTLLLSRLLPELRPLHGLGDASRRTLSEGIEQLSDGEGLLTGELWVCGESHAASLLIACWTRCLDHAGDGKPPWSGDAGDQYEWMVRQSLRLSDRHGRLAFASADTVGAAELLREALRLGGDDSDNAAAALRLKGYKADDSFETPDTPNHSEWAELGVLSAGWRDKAPRIVVAHPGERMFVEVHCGKQTLLAGEWPVDATIAGAPVRAAEDWETQCWHSDEDCDYLELNLPLEGGARLERQVFLSREDGVGFLAETLFSESGDQQDLRVASRVPLGDGVSLRPEIETREALLTAGGKAVAGVAPLALAEWRDDPRGGELTAEAGSLVLTREWSGRNAASPLWIDFSASRFEKQRTWRQLTVAELLKVVPHDVAVAYRVQSAKEQWLLYRSLDKPGNRTFLGQNFSSEMFIGKYNAPAGTNEEYLEIEGPEA